MNEAEYTVAGLGEENVITEGNGGMRDYLLFPFDPVRAWRNMFYGTRNTESTVFQVKPAQPVT